MISVEEAVARITSAFSPLAIETADISRAGGRVLAEDVRAKLSQPPYPVSSMDGYALLAIDAGEPGVKLRVIGAAPAGHPYSGSVSSGEAVRIFTGGVVPDGADTIVIQEDTIADDGQVTLNVAAIPGRHIRAVGLDFISGDILLPSGRRLSARDLSLIAAGDVAQVSVRQRPKIAVAATGDELSLPGEPRKPGGIVASSGYALTAMIERWGGVPIDLGILPDTQEAVANIADLSASADLIVTLGGASVGEHDLVQKALGPRGFELDFWKIAMRPGKPLIFGKLGKTSTLVCAMLFLRPAIAAMLGTKDKANILRARLLTGLKQNDGRQDYVRARIEIREGERFVDPFPIQDSSMLSALARADALIVRPPRAPSAEAGDQVTVIILE
jgi:molybdopterin molybdotransferase